MDIPWRAALLVVAGAFIVFLLAKLLPLTPRRAGASPGLLEARARVRSAATPRDRAIALCDAAEAALAQPFGSTRAAAYFMRAMRADPTFAGSVERAASALARRRARLLEKLLWRRLAATPWDAEHGPVVTALVASLAATARTSRGHAAQARVLGRVLAGEALRVQKPA